MAEETITGPEGTYQRHSPTRIGLDQELWWYSAPDEDGIPFIDPETNRYLRLLLAFPGPPVVATRAQGSLARMIGTLRAPEEVDHDTIRATLPAESLFKVPVSPDDRRGFETVVQVELTSGGGGRLDRLEWHLRVDRQQPGAGADTGSRSQRLRAETVVEFSDWDAPVDVDAPRPGEVEPTPGVDEEALAAVDWVRPFAPLPGLAPSPFWLLTGGGVLGPAPDAPSACSAVELRYEPMPPDGETPHPEWLYGSFLRLVLVRGDDGCDEGDRVPHGSPSGVFDAGPYRATRFHTEDGAPSVVEIVVGDTRILVESNLPERELAVALAGLGPLDLEMPPSAATM